MVKDRVLCVLREKGLATQWIQVLPGLKRKGRKPKRRNRMKKVLLAVLIVFVTTTVWAGSSTNPPTQSRAVRDRVYEVVGTTTPDLKFDLSGEFSAQGYYWDNYALKADDTVTHSYYKGYVSLFPKITVGNTSFIGKINMRDEKWGDFSVYSSDDPDSWSYLPSTNQNNDNIAIERAYLSHTFATKTVLDVGLMSGQWWATKFGDYMQPRYRVKVVQNTALGVVGGLVEKDAELGNPNVEDSEKDDYDSYALFGVTKLGTVYVKPLIFYVDRSSLVPNADKDGVKRLYISLGLDGDLGPIQFESEWTYQNTKYDDLRANVNPEIPQTLLLAYAEDSVVYGAYLNLFKTMDFGKPGIVLVYLGYDDEGGSVGSGHGLDSRQDFKANLILGDEIAFGSCPGQPAEDLLGMNMIKPYIQGMKATDSLTFDASFAYIMSNQDDYSAAYAYATQSQNVFKDATAWEIDLGANYKITPNLYYLVDAGYANIDFDEADDPDPVMVLKHEMLFTF